LRYLSYSVRSPFSFPVAFRVEIGKLARTMKSPIASAKLALLGGPKAVTIPFPPYPSVGYEEVNAATEAILTRNLSDTGRGPIIKRMEDSFARHFGSRYCLSVCSGTAAIHAGLFAVGVRPGVEVLTCGHTWISAIVTTQVASRRGMPPE
jgi:hypothetical protein